jgi:hypothetical protein
MAKQRFCFLRERTINPQTGTTTQKKLERTRCSGWLHSLTRCGAHGTNREKRCGYAVDPPRSRACEYRKRKKSASTYRRRTIRPACSRGEELNYTLILQDDGDSIGKKRILLRLRLLLSHKTKGIDFDARPLRFVDSRVTAHGHDNCCYDQRYS